jgi:hypothetical protein
VDSTGLHFTQVNLEGTLVFDTLAIYDQNEHYSVQGFRQTGPNELILWGRTRPITNDFQNFFIKTTLTGELLDEYYFGNPNDCNEGIMTCVLRDDGKLAVFFYRCLESVWPFSMYDDARFMLFNPSTMLPTQPDIILPMPDAFGEVVNFHQFTSSKATPDDGFIVSFVKVQTSMPVINYILKTDQYGNVEWYDSYTGPIAETNYAIYDIENALDGGYITTGEAESSTIGQHHWMLKIDSCGYEQPGFCQMLVDTTDSHAELARPYGDSASLLSVWPNPFYSQLKAVLPPTATRVFISDATGRNVFEEKVFYPNQVWNLSSLSDGVYVMNVELESGMMVSERIVKR